MDKIKNNIWIVILLLLLLVIFIPIKIPNNIPVYAKLAPAKELVTIKGSNGQIISHLVNNFSGIVEEIRTIQVDREDFASFNLNISDPNVLRGDTIAVFSSSHTNLIFEEVKGELLEQELILRSQLSGEKETIINEQEKLVEISKVNFANQKPIFERKSEMFKNELISEEDFDLERNLLEKYRLEVEREFEKLQVLKTGAKQEDIEVTKERITNLKNQNDILKSRISDYNIIAPFDGRLVGSNSLDTLFTLEKSYSYVLVIPIKTDLQNSVKIGQSINFDDSNNLENIKLEISDSQIKTINGENYIIYRSQFDTNEKLLNGIIECSIVGEEITIFHLLTKQIFGN